MADLERTFAIIKPDAVAKQATGAILQCIEASGLEIIAMKRLHMTEQLAEGFYAVHKQRPFFGDLVKFMTSGPVVVRCQNCGRSYKVRPKLAGKRLKCRECGEPIEAEAQ